MSPKTRSGLGILARGAALLFVGMSLMLTRRVLDELFPASLMRQWFMGTGLLAGFVLGKVAIIRRNSPVTKSHNIAVWVGGCLVAACVLPLALAVFPELVHRVLYWQAHTSTQFGLLSRHFAMLALFCVPLGFSWGCLSHRVVSAVDDSRSQRVLRTPLQCDAMIVLAGAWLAYQFAMPLIGLETASVCLVVGWCVLAVGGWQVLRNMQENPEVAVARSQGLAESDSWGTALQSRPAFNQASVNAAIWQRGITCMQQWTGNLWERWQSRLLLATGAICGALAIFACGWTGRFQPELAARLLYNPAAEFAAAAKVDSPMLTVLDEGRMMHLDVNADRTLSAWKHCGVQVRLHQNTQSAGMISMNSRICPQYSAEVLQALFPLTLHQAPESVLVLGATSGVPLKTSLAFPVQQVRCIEPDRQLVSYLNREVWNGLTDSPTEDERVQWTYASVPLALRSRLQQTYDVILSSPSWPNAIQGAVCYSRPFYASVARSLADDGIFCQRLPTTRFGPSVVRAILASVTAEFGDVVLLETAYGEWLILAAESEGLLKPAGFVDRLKQPHTRQVLAHVGWDWAFLLNLTAYDRQAIDNWLGPDSNPATGWNSHVAWASGPEFFRKALKPREVVVSFGKTAGRYAEWGDVEATDRELLRRLAEVTSQMQQMTGTPDEYWSYRKAVKEQVTKKPLSIIKQVKGEGPKRVLHPEDRRRLAYFKALDQALKTLKPSDIRRVETYTRPYDPLLTYFVHKEVAELYARTQPRCPADEIRHRLHAIHFAATNEKSVRNLAAALEVLAKFPQSTETPQQRWDHLNSLLQVMKLRWLARRGYTPRSPSVTLNDIRISIASAQAALDAMDGMTASQLVVAPEWPARRRFIELTVIGPLRRYRQQMFPHLKREQARKQVAGERNPAGDEE